MADRTARVRLTADTSSYVRSVNRAADSTDRLQNKVHRFAGSRWDARVGVQGTQQASSEVDDLRRRLERLEGRYRASVNVSTRGASRNLALILDTIGAIGPAAIAAGAAATAALGGIGATLGSVGAGAATAVLAFAGVGDAVEAMADAEAAASQNAVEAGRDRVQAAQQVADAQRGLSRAVERQRQVSMDAAQDIADAERALARTRRDAAASIAEAQRGVVDARRRAADLVASAQAEVAAAERNLTSAQRDQRYAQEELTRARFDALQAVYELREAVGDLALDEEGAEIRLIEARQRLNELTSSSTATSLELRKARLDVARAEDRLGDVRQEQTKTQNRLNYMEENGLDVDRRVIEAQRRLDASSRNVADAKREHAAAQQGVSDAQQEGARLIADAQRQVAEAERDAAEDIADAQRSLARAHQNGARQQQQASQRVADAQRQVKRALQDAAETMSKTSTESQKLTEEMAQLSPAGRDFAEFLFSLKPRLQELQRVAQSGMLPGVERGIRELLEIFPSLVRVVDNTAVAMGEMAAESGEALTSPFWQNYINFVATEAGPTLQTFGRIAGNLAKGFAGMQMAFNPMSRDVIAGLEDMTAGFAEWGATLGANENFQEFMDYARQVGPEVMETFRDIAEAIGAVVAAAAPLGGPTLEIIGGLADVIGFIASIPGVGTGLIAVATGMGMINRAIRGYEVAKHSRLVTMIQRTGTSATGVRGALAGAARFMVGPWGAAIGVATLGVGGLITYLVDASDAAGNMQDAMREASGTTRDFGLAQAEAMVQQDEVLSGLADEYGLRRVVATIMAGPQSAAYQQLTSEIDNNNNGIGDWLGLTGRLITTGHTKIDVLGRASEAYRREADEVGANATEHQLLTEAISEVSDEQLDLMLQSEGYQGTVDALTQTYGDQERQIDRVREAQERLQQKRADSRVTEREYQEAVDRATSSLETNGGTLDLNTEAGRRNDEALRDLITSGYDRIQSMADQGASSEVLRDEEERLRLKVHDVAEAHGINRGEVDTLWESYGNLGTRVETLPDARFIVTAEGVADLETLSALPGVGDAIDAANFATGGPIIGPGTGTSDDVPIRASNGEWVIRERVSSEQGRARMAALNSGQAEIIPKGMIDEGVPERRYALGGEIRTAGIQPPEELALRAYWASAEAVRAKLGPPVQDLVQRAEAAAQRMVAAQARQGVGGAPGLMPGGPMFGGVKPHVAAAGHEILRLFGPMPGGIGGVGQRSGPSDHPSGHALDFMTMSNVGLGNRVTNHFMNNWGRLAVKYVIWRQRINSGSGWRGMADRGSPTANHMDHPHVSFNRLDKGGLLDGTGWFRKDTIRPERVLSPEQNDSFERLVNTLSAPRPITVANRGPGNGDVVRELRSMQESLGEVLSKDRSIIVNDNSGDPTETARATKFAIRKGR